MDETRALEGRRVLIVEDQYYVATEMRAIVGRLGGVVIGPAKNAETALELLKREAPDVAILDVNLDGRRVYPVAEALRAMGKPFVFATGYESWAVDPRFASTPLVGKPVTAAAITTAIRQLEAPSAESVAT
jgi:two-component SAPR family response regulator